MWGGGYWFGPVQNITGGMTVDQAINIDTLGFKRGPLWAYDSAPYSYHCPGDIRFKAQRPGGTWAFDSYSKADGMNGQFVLVPPSSARPFIKMTQVKGVARAIVFAEEADPRGWNIGSWAFNYASTPSACAWGDTVASFHNNCSTFGFADAHAESHRWLEANTIAGASAAGQGKNVGMQPTKPIDRDLNWVIPRYQYLDFPEACAALP